MGCVRQGIAAHQETFQNHHTETPTLLGATENHFHINGHLRCCVRGFQDNLSAQKFHRLHGFHQFTILKHQTLLRFQGHGRSFGLLNLDDSRNISIIWNCKFLNGTQQKKRTTLGWIHYRFHIVDILGNQLIFDQHISRVNKHAFFRKALKSFSVTIIIYVTVIHITTSYSDFS